MRGPQADAPAGTARHELPGDVLFLGHLSKVLRGKGRIYRGERVALSGIGDTVPHLHIALKHRRYTTQDPVPVLTNIVRCKSATNIGAVRRIALIAIGFALVAGVAGESASPARTLQAADLVVVGTGPESQRRIGPYRPARSRQDYARAVRVFGKPLSWGLGSNLCVVRWRRLGLDLEFRVDRSCTPPQLRGLGSWCAAKMHTRRWRTKEGLRVGDPEARLHSLYRRATFLDAPPDPPRWYLSADRRLSAEVWGGIVVALRLRGTCV
jgi:hypothetical protein